MNIQKFVVNMQKGKTARQIVEAGNFGNVNQLIWEGIRKRRLTMNEIPAGARNIVLLGTDEEISFSHEMLAEAAKMKLKRPEHGDAFLFGQKYPEEQKKGRIVFLHDPAYLWSGHSFNIVLGKEGKQRTISLVASGGKWPQGCRFAFVEK